MLGRGPGATSRSRGPEAAAGGACERDPKPRTWGRARAVSRPVRGPRSPDGREVRRRREAGPGAQPEAGRRRGPRPLPGPLCLADLQAPTHPSPRPPGPPPCLFPPGLDLAPLWAPSVFPRRRRLLRTSGHVPEHGVRAELFIYSLLPAPTHSHSLHAFRVRILRETSRSPGIASPFPSRGLRPSQGPSLSPAPRDPLGALLEISLAWSEAS